MTRKQALLYGAFFVLCGVIGAAAYDLAATLFA